MSRYIKYMLVVLIALPCILYAHEAMAVDIRNAENFRIEVVVQPYYKEIKNNVAPNYSVDIIAINNSNETVSLGELVRKIIISPLREADFTVDDTFAMYRIDDRECIVMENIACRIYNLRVPEKTEIKPHSTEVLRSFLLFECRMIIQTEDPKPRSEAEKYPARNILVKVGYCESLSPPLNELISIISASGRGTYGTLLPSIDKNVKENKAVLQKVFDGVATILKVLLKPQKGPEPPMYK
ncbi:MAG: hypothetical protein JW946_04370 [Candidatus Omnitrophica bacterium]|nr:hypothetical protein [Candidatus Omnitrophota bacterium]